MTFVLDTTLENDTHLIAELELSQVRLSNNAAFPWIVLIPQRADMIEIIDLDETDRGLLLHDIVQASQIMKNLFKPTKLNVANIGNKVSQLHVHVIARYADDKAWPGPVWNSGVTADYDDTALQQRIELLKGAFHELTAGAAG